MKIIDINCKGVSFPKPSSTNGETLDFIIPPGYQWVAVDADGEVFAYRKKPRCAMPIWYGAGFSKKIGYILTPDGFVDGWDEMLIEVK